MNIQSINLWINLLYHDLEYVVDLSNSSSTSTEPKDEMAKPEDKMEERSNNINEKEKEKPGESTDFSDADSVFKSTPELKENKEGVTLSPSTKGRV